MSEDLINVGGDDLKAGVPPQPAPDSVGNKEKESLENVGSWLNNIKDEALRREPTLARFPDQEAALKGYVELRKQMGKNLFPDADTTEEQRIEFFRKAGIPDPEKYSIDAEKYGLSDDVTKQLKEIAANTGVTEDGLSKVFDVIMAEEQKVNEAQKAEFTAKLQTQVEGLKAEYGESFNKYQKLAGQVASEIYSEAEIAELKEQGFFSNPMVAKALMNVAKSRFGEELISDEHTQKGFAVSADQAQAKISEIMSDKAYFDKTDPRHKTLVKQMEDLHKVISAG